MKEYLLFDLDGTLTDPKLGITTCVQYALKAFGIEEPDLDKLEPFIGPPLKDSFMQFYQMTEEQALAAVEKYRERFKDTGLFENRVYIGIPEMLKKLQKKGMHLAVASSKPTVFVERILEHFGMKQYFEVIVGSELDGTRVNKDEVVAEALKQLFGERPVEKDKVYMIGDRKFDVEGARIQGVESVGVSYGYGSLQELQEAGADYIVESPGELSYFLLREFREVEPKGFNQVVLPVLGSLLLYVLAMQFSKSVIPLVLVGVAVFYWVRVCTLRAKYDMYVAHIRRDLPIAYILSIFVAMVLASGIDMLVVLTGISGKPAPGVTGQALWQNANLWSMLLVFGILLPVIEEFVFRGIVYNTLKFKMKLPLAMIVTALLYTLLQGGMERSPYILALGFVFAYVYEYFGNFAMPVILHVVSSVTWVFLCYTGVDETSLYNWPACIFALVLSVVCIGALHREKRII